MEVWTSLHTDWDTLRQSLPENTCETTEALGPSISPTHGNLDSSPLGVSSNTHQAWVSVTATLWAVGMYMKASVREDQQNHSLGSRVLPT